MPLGLSCLAPDPCEPLAGGAVASVVADEAPPADGEDAGVSGVGEAVSCFSDCVVSSFLAGASGEDVAFSPSVWFVAPWPAGAPVVGLVASPLLEVAPEPMPAPWVATFTTSANSSTAAMAKAAAMAVARRLSTRRSRSWAA